MKVTHTWKQGVNGKSQAGPKYVPIQQVEAAVTLAANNATRFTIQMFQEQMLLMLNSEFGFGRSRCMRALEAIQERLSDW